MAGVKDVVVGLAKHGVSILCGQAGVREEATDLCKVRVCYDFAGQISVLRDHDATPVVKDTGGQDDLLRLAGIVSSYPTRIDGHAGHDNTGRDRLHMP